MSAFAERRAAACDQTPFHNSSQTPFTGALCEQVDGYRSAAVAWARDAPPEDAGEGSEAAVVAAVHARILVPRPVARTAGRLGWPPCPLDFLDRRRSYAGCW